MRCRRCGRDLPSDQRLAGEAASLASAAAWVSATLIARADRERVDGLDIAARQLEPAVALVGALLCRAGVCEPRLRRVK